MYPYFLLAAFLQGPSLPTQTPLLDDCSHDARVIAMLRPTDGVQVRSSRDGESQTCYAVSARVGGHDVAGYVLGQSLPAVVDYERQRTEALKPNLAPVATRVAAPSEPLPRLRTFPDFSGLDMKNRRFSLSGLHGKLILVCFWSPRNPDSARELILVSRLFSVLHTQGLEAVGISVDLQRDEIIDSLEDFGTNFANIADTSGVADREGLSFGTIPYTYLLNRRHEVVASGLHKSNLEATVQKLLREQ